MELNDFASLIQLAAVFNGAFILSKEFSGKDFISIIKTDLLNIDEEICSTFNQLLASRNEIKKSLKELTPIRDDQGGSTNDRIEGAKIEVNDEIESIEKAQSDFTNDVNNHLTVNRFGKLCLTNFLFCIVTLFFSGCCNYRESIYLAGFCFYVFLIFLSEVIYTRWDFNQDKKHVLSSKHVIYINIGILLVSILVAYIGKRYFWFDVVDNKVLSYFMVVSGVVLPFLNFIVYYFYIGRQNIKIKNLLLEEEGKIRKRTKMNDWREIITFHVQRDNMFISSKPKETGIK